MVFILANILVLTVATLFFWWLSGYDSRVTGENQAQDRLRRGIRCGLTLLLVEPAFWGLWEYWQNDDHAAGFIYIAAMLPLALIWAGCTCELLSHGFIWTIDPEDKREFDPDKSLRDLDVVAKLIKHGWNEEAIQLCHKLKESGDVSVAGMETMLARLGVPQASVQNNMPLNQASRLRAQFKFAEAETLLKSLLLKNPANMDAALMLMRLYAQDLGRADKAREILRAIEKQPYVSHAHIEYAHRSIDEWSQPKPEPEPVVIETKSVDELIEHRRFGTAIEMLEQKVREQPADFDSWLKIIEVHGRYCGNIKRAEKIVEQIEADPAFSPEQSSLAKTKLAAWRQIHQAKF